MVVILLQATSKTHPVNPYEENRQTWNKVAQLYQDQFMNLRLYDASYDHFLDCLPQKEARLLDVGCGPGNISRYLSQKRPGWIFEGIDAAPNMVALAAKNIPVATFSVLDCRDLDRLETQYHGVASGFCLPYLDPAAGVKLLHDAHQLLMPGGCLYLSFVPGDPAKSGYLTGSTGDRTFFHYYDSDHLNQLLQDAGFDEIQDFRIHYPEELGGPAEHVVLIGRKKDFSD